MSHILKRISTTPASTMRILVDQADPSNPADTGMAIGGSFYFEPAGQDGDTAQVSEHAARVIMGDPGLAPHFECTPPVVLEQAQPDGAGAAADDEQV